MADLGQLNGVYVPFWTFDSMTYTHYTGERGDDYWETETYTETNAQGQTETKTRQVRKTRWTPVAGHNVACMPSGRYCAATCGNARPCRRSARRRIVWPSISRRRLPWRAKAQANSPEAQIRQCRADVAQGRDMRICHIAISPVRRPTLVCRFILPQEAP